MNTGIIYTRVSTDEQNKGNSPDDQLRACREYAERNGINVPEALVFHEDYSGFEYHRPELDKIRARLQKCKGYTLIIRSGDRLARSVVVAGMLASEFAQYGLELHFVSRGKVDYCSPEGQFIFFMEAVGNQYWGQKAKEAMQNGRRAQAEKGIPVGQGAAAYGYRKEGRKRETRYVVVPDETVIVIRIFEMYVNQRMTTADIARALNADGVPSRDGRSKWVPSSINSLIRKEAYAGIVYTYRYKRVGNKTVQTPREEWVPIHIEPIVDRALWEKAQIISAEKRSREAGRQPKYEYLMARRLTCQCEKSMHGKRSRGNRSNDHFRYVCATRNRSKDFGPPCGAPMYIVRDVDRAVWEWVEELYKNPDKVLQGFRKAQAYIDEQNAATQAHIGRIEAEIARQRKRLNNLMRSNADLDPDEDKEAITALNIARDEIQQAIRDGELQRDEWARKLIKQITEEFIQEFLKYAEQLREGVEKADTFEKRRRVIDAINITAKLETKEGVRVARIRWYGITDTVSIENRSAS